MLLSHISYHYTTAWANEKQNWHVSSLKMEWNIEPTVDQYYAVLCICNESQTSNARRLLALTILHGTWTQS